MNTEGILDKVMENKQAEDLSQFDALLVLQALFAELQEREQQVLSRRFGLAGEEPQTLEMIGKHFGVTRERVRQIETGSVKKLKKILASSTELKQVEQVLHQVLHQHGGAMEENHLLDSMLSERREERMHRAIVLFVIERLLSEKLDLFNHADHYHRSWKLVTVEHPQVESRVNKLVDLVKSHEEPVHEDDLIAKAIEQLENAHERLVRGHLRIAKRLKQNIFGQWGLSEWTSITPKRMNDKIYLVLKHVQKPMHFTEIAQKINELGFDHKIAYPATVHNELILDEKYVLVGRGIYALAEWGYEPGVVSEVIRRVLERAAKPLTREEIVDKVLEQRLVGKSTVHLALMNKKHFEKREDGSFVLVDNDEVVEEQPAS